MRWGWMRGELKKGVEDSKIEWGKDRERKWMKSTLVKYLRNRIFYSRKRLLERATTLYCNIFIYQLVFLSVHFLPFFFLLFFPLFTLQLFCIYEYFFLIAIWNIHSTVNLFVSLNRKKKKNRVEKREKNYWIKKKF